MNRQFYLDLAASGLSMPIGTHLVLHEHPDYAAIVQDGARLGRVVEESAHRFRMPLAFPLMDLKLEKEALLLARGVPATAVVGTESHQIKLASKDQHALTIHQVEMSLREPSVARGQTP